VTPRPVLSDEDEQAERDERARLRTLDAKLSSLFRRRQELIAEMRQLSGEQKALYDRRQAPQVEVEELYHQHGQIGHRIVELRKARDAAKTAFQEAVVRLRELKLSFAPGERVHPDQMRREIAELELRQQTRALPLDEENALIARLRQRTQELKEAEARAGVVAEHVRALKEAETRVSAARAEVDRLGHEIVKAKSDRDGKMGEVRAKLEVAGGLVAELRAKGRARAEVMAQVDAVSREMAELEREGRQILEHSRARRDEARKTLRTYTRRGRTPEDLLASTAEAQLEELLKRGKVTLGG